MGTGVVITGMGLATSLGVDVETTWSAIRAGRTGFGPMSAMESSLPEGSLGGQAAELASTFAPDLPREGRYLRWVVESSLRNAGAMPGAGWKSERRCTILGTTLHGLRAGGRFLRSDDPGELRYFLSNSMMRTATAGLGLEGASITTCSACSSSLGAIALGITMLETGMADLVVAGGYDPVSEYAWGGFNALRLVSPDGVRPFAKSRRGMMLGEGYAVVVLERATDATRRGAKALVTIEGWGESADAHHLTQPDPTGSGAARAITKALERAGGAGSAEVSMIAAHATATPDNDAGEYAAFRSVFADRLEQTPVVGFKSYLGHTLGGAGAVELILSACALNTGWVPPCATVTQDDIAFEGLRVAPPGGIEKRISRTLNTSLGFGGANTCVILGKGEHGTSSTPAQTEHEAWITGFGLIVPGAVGAGALLEFLAHGNNQFAAQVSDELLGTVLNARRVRRLGTCVKLMLASASLALRHAGLESDPERLGKASAILASTHGSSNFCSEYYTQIVKDGVMNANPVLFAEGVPNAAAAHVSTNLAIKGACQTFIGSRTAGLDALGMAAARVRSGASDIVLVGAAEETHASVDRAYRHFMGEASRARFRTSPGGVAIVVESSESARARGVKPIARVGRYASVSGSHVASGGDVDTPRGDADRGVATCAQEFDSPQRAIAALTGLGRDAVVLASGNGTWIDRAEARAARVGAQVRPSRAAAIGDFFSAGPLLDIVMALEEGKAARFAALCTDFTGPASAVQIEPVRD